MFIGLVSGLYFRDFWWEIIYDCFLGILISIILNYGFRFSIWVVIKVKFFFEI